MIQKRFSLSLVILSVLSGCAVPRAYEREKAEVRARPESAEKRIIVLDPGHGGQAKGAVGPTGLKEKDVVLDIARRLQKVLNDSGGYQVYLTRQGDYEVSLVSRRDLAKKKKADLFLSIHCDGNRNRSWNGTAVYVLSPKGDSIVKERALTNGDYLLDASSLLDGSNDYVQRTVVDLIQTDTKRESRRLAEKAVESLCRELGTKNLGVKKANFAVLKNVDVPSVLVEAAFITNWWEEKLLKKAAFRQRVAEALSRAIGEYNQFP